MMHRLQDSLTLNPHLANTRKSATLAINERSKALMAQGKKVYRFGLGQSPFPVPLCMVKALQQAANIKDYLAVQGLLSLRESISNYLKRTEYISFSADDIIIGPGTKELMYSLQNVLHTELLLPAPSWVSYQPQATLCGLACHWVPCYADNNWKFTIEALKQTIQHHPDARLLILNSPNNPSGACFDEAELIAIAEVARAHNIIVLSDEIYSSLHYTQQHISLARYYPEGTIISNGISKWSGAGGWRLGFMAFPEALKTVLDGMIVIASETYTSVSAPIQYAAIKAFEPGSELKQYIQATQHIMAFITQTYCEKLRELNIVCPKAEGGFYLLCVFEAQKEALCDLGLVSSAQLCERLLNDTGIAALPGNDFGLPEDEFSLRLALVDFDGAKSLQDYQQNGTQSLTIENPIYNDLFNSLQQLQLWLLKLSN